MAPVLRLLLLIVVPVGLYVLLLSRSSKEQEAYHQCSLTPKNPEDRRLNKTTLRLVHWNVEWLFTQGGRGSVRCPGHMCTWPDRQAGLGHLDRVTDVLKKIDGDIVSLVEVEDCAVLGPIVDRLKSGYQPYLTKSRDTALGQHLALLTRIDPHRLLFDDSSVFYPIEGSKCLGKYKGSTSLSKHFVAHFQIGNRPITLIAVHLIARPRDRSRCGKREAQAMIVDNLIKEHSRIDGSLIVMGDFNDHDGDLNGTEPLSPLVFDLIKRKHNLTNVASLLPPIDRYTNWWDRNKNCRVDRNELTMIDHVLVSADLSDLIVNVKIGHDLFKASCDTYKRTSDHWPIIVDLKF